MQIYLTTDDTTKVGTMKFSKAQKSAKKIFSLGSFSQQSMVKKHHLFPQALKISLKYNFSPVFTKLFGKR